MPPPKPQICLLLALWGKKYIRLFCDISLRSLLAEGNIPALAKEYSCTFTLLTKPEDIRFFEAQPLFPLLKQYCEIRYVDIADVIYPHNHSATLTVGLERGIRAHGDALNTYFIFLVADYLFAAQSLSGLLPYLRRGVSAITAGNYQVVEEEVLEDIKRFVEPSSGTISIPNRELVGWSLRHLHPMTAANTVNAGETRTLHANRLFWRVDDDTLIGRFYLRHMICIKPETMDYVIGSSCDYSFIREMCPSGNVVHLADSDEYFVIELQPLLHEGKYIAVGRHDPQSLAVDLAAWTTADQRANAHTATLFHAADIPAPAKASVEESQNYVSQVEQLMPNAPLPVRGHFYWLNCIQWITAAMAEEPEEYTKNVGSLRRNIWRSAVFGPPFKSAGVTLDRFPPMRDEDVSDDRRWMLQWYKFYIGLFGQLPDVRIWHPHYLDYRLLQEALKKESGGPVLLILPPKRRNWIEWSENPRFVLRTPLIAYRDTEELHEELKGFSACVIHLPDEYDSITGLVFDRLLQAMPAARRIHIFVKSPMFSSRLYSSRHRALRYAHLGQKPGVKLVAQRSYEGRTRRFVDRWMNILAAQLINNQQTPLSRLWNALQVALLHSYYILHNATFPMRRPFESGLDRTVCSAVLTFEVEREEI